MADLGHVLTDKELEALEKRIAEEYAKASRDMKRKYREYMAKFEEERQKKYQLWKDGKITKKEYTDFVYRKTMVGNRWKEMQQVLAADLQHADEMALGIARDKMPDIFALNANFGTYDIEHGGKIDTGFTLYNHDTAAYLMEDCQLMPGPSTKKAAQIAADKSMQWNQRHIQSAVLQGVLQGESPYKVAERLTGVAQMGLNASIRYARTMTTSVQNAGRYESYHRAKKLGVDLTIEWQATLDGRTRHEHRMMHGQRRNVDEPFELDGVKILYPAQSSGAGSSDIPQSMIWNCRCTLLAWVKGFEGETVKSSPKMGEMSFEEWQHEKEQKKPKEEKTVSRRAKTREEAYRILTDDVGFHEVSPSMRYIDDETVIAQANQLAELNAKYHAIGDGFGGYIGAENTKKFEAATNGSFKNADSQNLVFSFDYFAHGFDNVINQTKKEILSGWAMPAIESKFGVYTVTHEYGHILQNVLMSKRIDLDAYNEARKKIGINPQKLKKLTRQTSNNAAKEMFTEIIEIAKESNPAFSLKENISGYGKSNYEEAFAEVFANSQLGKPNELGKAMLIWLERHGL